MHRNYKGIRFEPYAGKIRCEVYMRNATIHPWQSHIRLVNADT
jgi:hypothetical protein